MQGTIDGQPEAGVAEDSAHGSAERILAAGMRILEEEGYEGLSMRKVGAAVGLGTTLLAPMSFAAGASTLLLAIVIDACYGGGSASGAR